MAATSEAILGLGLCSKKSNFLVSSKHCSGYRNEKVKSLRRKCYNVRCGPNVSSDRFRSLICKCRKIESVSDAVSEKSDPLVKGELSANGNGPFSSSLNVGGVNSIEEEAWELLRASMVYYCGNPVGTIAANDPSDSSILNYDQVFIRDFIPSGIAFLLKGEYDIVRNFILHTLQLQSWEKTMDCHSPGQGLMPASFKVRTVPLDGDDSATEDILDPDFGEAAIGRVAPVDSGLWWIILLRAYGKCTGDLSVQERVDVQTGIKMILKLCLADGFDMFPTLLVTDGSCMIDRRMGIHGHPLEIQALFYSALLSAREMLVREDASADLITALNNRLVALSFHVREYYWIDMRKLNEIYRYKTEEYSYDAVNKFNIYPDQIPPWLVEWMPNKGGYMIGNLQPAHMDFRFFSLGNLWSIVSSLATNDQSHAILDLYEAKWADLIGDMPLKICYPALEGQEWRIITGSDPKNTPWSYHNGGSWPTLLWQLTVASIKMNRPEIAENAVKVAERRISKDKWAEYYDTKRGRFIGKQARLFQTWSIAGYIVAKQLLDNPDAAKILVNVEDTDQAPKVPAVDATSNYNASSFLTNSSTNDDNKGDAAEPSPCNKVESSCTGPTDHHANILQFPLFKPKDVLNRIAFPPHKDLDLMLLDNMKPTSTSKAHNGGSLPTFPWSHVSGGHFKANPDVVKSAPSKSTCQGRWVKMGKSITSLWDTGTTSYLAEFQYLTYNQSLVPLQSQQLGSAEKEKPPLISTFDREATPSGTRTTSKNPAGHSAGVLSAAQTLCDLAAEFRKQDQYGLASWQKKSSHKSIRASKLTSDEKLEKALFTIPSSRSVETTTNLINNTKSHSSKKIKLDPTKGQYHWSTFTPQSSRSSSSSPSKSFKNKNSSMEGKLHESSSSPLKRSITAPPAKIPNKPSKLRKLVPVEWRSRGDEKGNAKY